MKDKKKLRKHHRLEEAKEAKQQNAMWDPELELGQKNGQ